MYKVTILQGNLHSYLRRNERFYIEKHGKRPKIYVLEDSTRFSAIKQAKDKMIEIYPNTKKEDWKIRDKSYRNKSYIIVSHLHCKYFSLIQKIT